MIKLCHVRIILLAVLLPNQCAHAGLLRSTFIRILVELGFLSHKINQLNTHLLPSQEEYAKLTQGYTIDCPFPGKFIALRMAANDGRSIPQKIIADQLAKRPQPVIETLSMSSRTNSKELKTFYALFTLHNAECIISGPIKHQERSQWLVDPLDVRVLNDKNLARFLNIERASTDAATKPSIKCVDTMTWSTQWGTYTAKIENASPESRITITWEPTSKMQKIHEQRLMASSRAAQRSESLFSSEYRESI